MQRIAKNYSWANLPVDHPIDLIDRCRVMGDRMMISYLTLHQGFHVAPHEHDNEQFTVMLSGKLKFEIFDNDGIEPRILEIGAGEVLHLPGGVRHGATAIETSVLLDLFSPPAEFTGVDQNSKKKPS